MMETIVRYLSEAENASVAISFASLIVTIGALGVAYVQIRASSKSNKEALAFQSHREYLKICFDNPQYSSSDQYVAAFKAENLQRLLSEKTLDQVRYNWFLSSMLSTCEQILVYAPSDREWSATVRDQIRYHRAAMMVIWPSWGMLYERELAALVDEVLEEKDASAGQDSGQSRSSGGLRPRVPKSPGFEIQ